MSRGQKIYEYTLGGACIITLVMCFICNLAVERRLSWFYIVALSLLLAFNITHLPLLLKRYRWTLSFIAVTLSIYAVVIASICLYSSTNVLRQSLIITTYPLLFLWLAFGVCHLKQVNAVMKSSFVVLILGIMVSTINTLISSIWETSAGSFSGGRYVLICCIVYFVISMAVGVYKQFEMK